MPEAYDEEAVQQILRLAMEKQGQGGPLLRSQLLEIAQDLGISEAALGAAEEEWQVQTEEQQAREQFAAYRHQQLRQSIVRFIIINSILVILNGLTAHRIDWSVYPVLLWGMAIVLQAWQVLRSEGENYDRAFRRWRLRQQIGASFKAISERLKLSWSRANPTSSQSALDKRYRTTSNCSSSESASNESDETLGAQSNLASHYPNQNIVDQNRINQGNFDQTSPAQKSRRHNRIGQRYSHQNRLGHLSSGLSKERDHDEADKMP